MQDDLNGPIVSLSTPAKIERFSRGFYQLDEAFLYVPLYPNGKFYSYLDADIKNSENQNNQSLFFDIDRGGNLAFVKLQYPREKWPVREQIGVPDTILTAEVHFRQFREQLKEFEVITNRDRNCLCLIFASEANNASAYRITDNLLIEITENSSISRIWITDIIDDRATRKMAIWRKQIRSDSES